MIDILVCVGLLVIIILCGVLNRLRGNWGAKTLWYSKYSEQENRNKVCR